MTKNIQKHATVAAVRDGHLRMLTKRMLAYEGMDDVLYEDVDFSLGNSTSRVRAGTGLTCKDRNAVLIEMAECMLENSDSHTHPSNPRVPLELIERGLEDSDISVRVHAMRLCVGRGDVPLEIIERGLEDDEPTIRISALLLCVGREDIPFEIIERGLEDGDNEIRAIALIACLGRDDVPLDLIEWGLEDSDNEVRGLARKLYEERGDRMRVADKQMSEGGYSGGKNSAGLGHTNAIPLMNFFKKS